MRKLLRLMKTYADCTTTKAYKDILAEKNRQALAAELKKTPISVDLKALAAELKKTPVSVELKDLKDLKALAAELKKTPVSVELKDLKDISKQLKWISVTCYFTLLIALCVNV